MIGTKYKKGEFILRQGEKAKGIGMVISGTVHIIREDFLGNREILAEVVPGEIFDEVYALLHEEVQSVGAIAKEDCQVVFYPVSEFLEMDENRLFLMGVLARKNLMLTRKIEHLSKRTVRGKIISYLSDESARRGTLKFKISFNRQQLADYLAVERSALSRELSKMKAEGLIEFYKNEFLLYNIGQ